MRLGFRGDGWWVDGGWVQADSPKEIHFALFCGHLPFSVPPPFSFFFVSCYENVDKRRRCTEMN